MTSLGPKVLSTLAIIWTKLQIQLWFPDFTSKKIFWKEIFISVVVFFLFLKLPMARRVQVCRIVGALNNTYFTAVPWLGSPLVGGGNTTADQNCCTLEKTRKHVPNFWWQKLAILLLNLRFFWWVGSFSIETNPISNLEEENCYLWIVFKEVRINFIYPK